MLKTDSQKLSEIKSKSKYHTVKTVQKSNGKIVEAAKIDKIDCSQTVHK